MTFFIIQKFNIEKHPSIEKKCCTFKKLRIMVVICCTSYKHVCLVDWIDVKISFLNQFWKKTFSALLATRKIFILCSFRLGLIYEWYKSCMSGVCKCVSYKNTM